jgi:DNA polymerase-3 subunit alpha
MQKYLKDLKPNRFEDLIAMNALYRPGPLAYIPNFIKRKHGQEAIVYDLEVMEEYLKDTYGITVYQEQVMLLSQKLANFSKGEADTLRKAMGKKNKVLLDKMYQKFIDGCMKNGHEEQISKKIWSDWKAFAQYAFNKSHSTCYAFLAFQTAFLKAHYPTEFIAANLNNNRSNISELYFQLTEAKRMGITVLGPDINESKMDFSINEKGQIRFGLSALKGVGEGPVQEIIKCRHKDKFKNIFDLIRRVNLKSVNKKCLDALAMGGAFDSFNLPRAAYFSNSGNFPTFIEHLLRYGSQFQTLKGGAQASLFGDSIDQSISEPNVPHTEEWIQKYKLEKEKEVTGIYLSAHPLDEFSLEFKHFIKNKIEDIDSVFERNLTIGGMVTHMHIRESQRGTKWAIVTIEDHYGSKELRLFTETFQKFASLLEVGNIVYVEGINTKNRGSEIYTFNIKDIRLLDEIAKKFTKGITVKIPLFAIKDSTIEQMMDILKDFPGDTIFKVKVVIESDQDIELDLISEIRVRVDFELIQELTKMGFQYRIDK